MWFTPTGAVAFTSALFGAGTGSVYLDEVECSGSESHLIDCPRSATISCYQPYTSRGGAGVRCQGNYKVNINLNFV